jgi:hypothetical protein
MSAETMHRLIGRALTDTRFRERLLCQPGLAAGEFSLTPFERHLIGSLRADTLEALSQQLAAGLEAGDPLTLEAAAD